MRKDVKLGILAGFVIVLVVAMYLFWPNGAPPKGQELPETAEGVGGLDEGILGEDPGSYERDIGEGIIAFRGIQRDSETTKQEETIPSPRPVEIARTTERPLPGETPQKASPPVPLQGTVEVVRVEPPLKEPTGVPGKELTTIKEPLRPETYVVRVDDSTGFWGIAGKVYGDRGKYGLIEKANPGVNSRRLRAGQRLVIPPLPKRRAPDRTALAPPGKLVETPTGNVYTVESGDSRGFWGIAEKVYGSGDKYGLIAKANPQVDPRKLRPGQRLVMPLRTATKPPGGEVVETARSKVVGPKRLEVPTDGRPRFYDVFRPES